MRLAAAAFALLFSLFPASAQTAPQRITGTIESFAAAVLTVKTANGENLAITLPPEARVVANEKSQFSSIKPGDFVASTAAPSKDGRLQAKEVRIFPPSLRGLGEGQYPHADGSLTNAAVVSATAAPKGKGGVLTLSFHGSMPGPNGSCSGHAPAPGQGPCMGEAEIAVTAKTAVTAWVLGDLTWLEQGKAVSLFAVTGPGGKLSSPGVLVAHNGVKPLP